jgi:hypothetical protein
VKVAVMMLACCAVSCTTPTSPATSPTPQPATVHVRGIRFDVGCTPVAEALVDIELPRHGGPATRAITGLWDHQAIAVLANDPKGCGLWTLALATGLSAAAKTQIQDETSRGVEAFGVTASPVPHAEGHG